MHNLTFGFFDDSGVSRKDRILMFYSFENEDRLGRIIWPAKEPENREHPFDERVVELWNDPHFFPATA